MRSSRCRPLRRSLYPAEAQFAVAAATLMLLVAGIHNAWDAVTWHLMVRRRGASDSEKR